MKGSDAGVPSSPSGVSLRRLQREDSEEELDDDSEVEEPGDD